MNGNGFTPTQQRIMDVLRDGRPHDWREVAACLDEQATRTSVAPHLTALRKILRLKGLEIACVKQGYGTLYRLFRLVSSD